MTNAQLALLLAKMDLIIASNTLSPPGTIIQFAGSVTPSGYLLCDGTAISRTTFSALFAAIGVAWGAGNGTTTFNLPDMRGRSPVGVGDNGTDPARVLADVGGEATHVLITSEIAAHTHGVTDPTHHHGPLGGGNFIIDGAGTEYVGVAGTKGNTDQFTSDNATGVTVNSEGGGFAHNNMHPFAAVNYFIKT